MSTVHDLKCMSQYFDALKSGAKTFELRRNDRDYQVGDVLRLRKWGGEMRHRYWDEEPLYFIVTYMLWQCGFGLKKGYVILGIAPTHATLHPRLSKTAITEPNQTNDTNSGIDF